jgi:hypothetical protein
MRRRTAGVGVILALVAGCGGGGDGDPFVDLAAEAPVIVTHGPPSVAESGPSGVPSTATVSTTALPSPVASSGDPPIEPPASLPVSATGTEGPGSIDAGFQATVDASVECLAAPAECLVESVVAIGGPEHDRYGRLVSHYAVAGYVVRRATGVSSMTVEESELGADGMSGFVVVCDVDGDIVVEPGSTNGFGLDLVINDQVVARRVRVELRVVDGEWRRWAIEPIGEWPMEATCLAA